jgi:transglutaminase-like putative cysteine protease
VYVLAGISASRRLGDPARLSEVVLELTAPEGKQVPDLPETANQTVERKPNGSVIVKTSRNQGKPQLASAADRAEALKSTQRYPLDNESVRQLAARAVKGAGDDRSAVQKLLRFTRSYIKEALNAKSLTVIDVIQSKKGDCTAHALLFTTLARAAGIPARETRGWMYSGDRNQAFGGHAWSEVILDGQWVPVDSVWAEIQLSPGYIQAH